MPVREDAVGRRRLGLTEVAFHPLLGRARATLTLLVVVVAIGLALASAAGAVIWAVASALHHAANN